MERKKNDIDWIRIDVYGGALDECILSGTEEGLLSFAEWVKKYVKNNEYDGFDKVKYHELSEIRIPALQVLSGGKEKPFLLESIERQVKTQKKHEIIFWILSIVVFIVVIIFVIYLWG